MGLTYEQIFQEWDEHQKGFDQPRYRVDGEQDNFGDTNLNVVTLNSRDSRLPIPISSRLLHGLIVSFFPTWAGLHAVTRAFDAIQYEPIGSRDIITSNNIYLVRKKMLVDTLETFNKEERCYYGPEDKKKFESKKGREDASSKQIQNDNADNVTSSEVEM